MLQFDGINITKTFPLMSKVEYVDKLSICPEVYMLSGNGFIYLIKDNTIKNIEMNQKIL